MRTVWFIRCLLLAVLYLAAIACFAVAYHQVAT